MPSALNGQAESDDPTSSSENESLSSDDHDGNSKPISRLVSQARAPSPIRSEPDESFPSRSQPRLQPGVNGRAPRKLDKARDAIHWSFAYIAEITGGAKLGIPPWAGLLQALINLRELFEDSRVRAASDLARLTSIILLLVKHRILPLSRDRAYGKQLSKTEAKSRTRLLKIWPTLHPLLEALGTSHGAGDDLHDVSAELLARVALCALDYGHAILNLDKGVAQKGCLPVAGPVTSHQLLRCFDRFGISSKDITTISISNSDLDVCPSWVFGTAPGPMAFPNLEYLDTSHNKRLSSLPIRAALCLTLRVNSTGTDLLTTQIPALPASDALLEIHNGPFRRKATSLVQACLRVLLMSNADPDLAKYLSDHLARMLKQSYLCEICHSTCVPDTWNWRDLSCFAHHNSGVTVDRSRSLRMRGRICNSCVYIANKELHEG